MVLVGPLCEKYAQQNTFTAQEAEEKGKSPVEGPCPCVGAIDRGRRMTDHLLQNAPPLRRAPSFTSKNRTLSAAKWRAGMLRAGDQSISFSIDGSFDSNFEPEQLDFKSRVGIFMEGLNEEMQHTWQSGLGRATEDLVFKTISFLDMSEGHKKSGKLTVLDDFLRNAAHLAALDNNIAQLESIYTIAPEMCRFPENAHLQ